MSLASSKLPWRTIVGWGLGSTCLGATNFAKILVLGFLVDYVGMAAAAAAGIVAVSTLVDVFTNPIIGGLSDRARSPWGRRLPFMFFGALLLCFAWALIFNAPASLTGSSLVAYVAFALVVFSMGYGAFGVPYNAIPAEITDDYHTRTLMMSARSVFSTIGTSAGGFLAPTLIAHFGGGRAGHAGMSLVMGLFVFVTGVVCVLLIGRQPNVDTVNKRVSFRRQVGSMLENRHFVVLLASHLFGMVGVMMMNGGAVFYVRRVLGGDEKWLGSFFLYLNVVMFLSLPVCLWLGRKVGKRDTFIIGSIVLSLASFSWYWASLDEPWLIFMARVIGISFGSAAMIVMSSAMLPDTIEYDTRRTGLRREGVYAGFYTTAEKASSALGMALVGIVLSTFGYVQAGGDTLVQSPRALFGVVAAFGFGPGVTIFIGGVLMFFYGLDEKALKSAVLDEEGEAEPRAALDKEVYAS
ncbi:MFS transporter [Novosphingobium sp. BL-52-GroH]|uniref:MFS transporter n=1 Tax=Novosphingobium sp. BL-52-GroH TaxID=3349877 RepID=UPI0038508199